jgi:hypothetical protein
MTSTAATRYRALIADLVTASRRHETALVAASQSYADGVASVDHDVAAAQDSADAATARAGQAHRIVAQTDLAATALWDELKRIRGRRARRLGPVPPPATSESAETDPITLLENVAALLDRARRGGEPLPALVLPLLFGLGSACAAGLALLGVALLGGSDARFGAVGVVAGWLVLLAAPLAGLPPARSWVDQRFSARLDAGATGVLVLGGMLATCAITLTLR